MLSATLQSNGWQEQTTTRTYETKRVRTFLSQNGERAKYDDDKALPPDSIRQQDQMSSSSSPRSEACGRRHHRRSTFFPMCDGVHGKSHAQFIAWGPMATKPPMQTRLPRTPASEHSWIGQGGIAPRRTLTFRGRGTSRITKVIGLFAKRGCL